MQEHWAVPGGWRHRIAARRGFVTKEPRVNPGLLALQNVVLLPHLGSATVESRTAMGMRALENLVAWSEGRALPDRVV